MLLLLLLLLWLLLLFELPQIQEEVLGALDFMRHVYGVFGMTYKLERSTRPKKAVGLETPDGVQRWDDAEAALAAALDKFAGPGNWKDNPGDGAFYGPKIDIKVFDCMERMHQCATIQVRGLVRLRVFTYYLVARCDDCVCVRATSSCNPLLLGVCVNSRDEKNLPTFWMRIHQHTLIFS